LGLKRRALGDAIPAGAQIVLDTSPLIAYLEGSQGISEAATLLIDDWIRNGRNRGVVSTVSALELFVGVERSTGPGADNLLDFLLQFPNLETIAVDLDIAREAAKVRASTRLKAPDAIIIATAKKTSATIATNDREWSKRCPALPIVTLDDFT